MPKIFQISCKMAVVQALVGVGVLCSSIAFMLREVDKTTCSVSAPPRRSLVSLMLRARTGSLPKGGPALTTRLCALQSPYERDRMLNERDRLETDYQGGGQKGIAAGAFVHGVCVSWLRVCGLETVNAGCVACLFCVFWLGGFNAPRCGPCPLFYYSWLVYEHLIPFRKLTHTHIHTHPHTGRKAFEIRDYLTKLSPEIATQLPERKSSSKKR